MASLLVVVSVVGFGVARLRSSSDSDASLREPVVCPSGTVRDCEDLAASVFGVKEVSFPRELPDVTFREGFFTNIAGGKSVWLAFDESEPTDTTYLLVASPIQPGERLRARDRREAARGGWSERKWVVGRDGRRYLATIINGRVLNYTVIVGPLKYQARVDSFESITTARHREVVRGLLDAVG